MEPLALSCCWLTWLTTKTVRGFFLLPSFRSAFSFRGVKPNRPSKTNTEPLCAVTHRKKKWHSVFTGDEFADGEKIIRSTLAKHKVKASFFLTGNFYQNPSFKKIIIDLEKEGHYLGAHSDKHLLYDDWSKRDSLLIKRPEFVSDVETNFSRMGEFGITKSGAPFFYSTLRTVQC